MATKVGVLGSGIVGEVLSDGFLKHGYDVMRGSRDPQKLEDWQKKNEGKGQVGTFEEVAAWGELLVLAVKGGGAEAVLELAGIENFEGKTVIDATNPISDHPPINNVLPFFTGPNESLMEKLQELVPKAHFVKAFSSVGNARMVNPDFKGILPTMFMCGNDASSKETVSEILAKFGWETQDMGGIEAARAIEPLCILWCIPGFKDNHWTHAFKLLR